MANALNDENDDREALQANSTDASADEDVPGSDADSVPTRVVERPVSHRPAVEAGLLAAVNAAAAAFAGSHYAYQHAGASNHNVSFLIPWMDVVAGLVWLASIVLLVRAVWGGMGAARHVAVGGLVACLATQLATVLTSPARADRYEGGFKTWAGTKLDADAVRGWAAGLGGGPEIPAANWPPAVTAVEPTAVERPAGGQGVILRWGTPGGWGYARRAFVAAMPRGVSAPDDGKGGWRSAAEGVSVGLQQGE